MIYECEKCHTPLPPKAEQCPKCSEKFAQPVPDDAEGASAGFRARSAETIESKGSSPNLIRLQKPVTACVGAFILLLGVFAPTLTVPMIGLLNNGFGITADGASSISSSPIGLIVMALAIAAAFCGIKRINSGLWASGGLSFAAIAFFYFSVTNALSHPNHPKMLSGIQLLPFISDSVSGPPTISWGMGVLILGAGLIFLAAGLTEKENVKIKESI